VHDSDDSFIDDSEYDTDASSCSGKAKENAGGDDDDDEVQLLGSGSEDEWRPRRRTRQAAAVKKYSLLTHEFFLLKLCWIQIGIYNQ